MLMVRWFIIATAFVSCIQSPTAMSASRHEPDSWREVVGSESAGQADVEAAIAYATYLSTEPEDYPAAEKALVDALSRYPYSVDLLDAIRLLWTEQRLKPSEKADRVLRDLPPIADDAPDSELLILLVARVERSRGDGKTARRRVERCARYAGWESPLLVREWLSCLDPKKDGRYGRERIGKFSNNPKLRGTWAFERFAADFLNDLARIETRLWKKRKLQQQAWQHTLRATQDLNRQASARTAWPLANRLVQFGLPDQARELLDHVAILDRGDLRTQQLRAVLHERAGNWPYALQIWRSLIEQRDTIPQLYLGAARCLDMTNHPKEGTAYLEKAARLTIDPRRSIPLGLTVAQRLIAEKQPERALRATAGTPKTPAIYAVRAQAYAHLGKIEAAKKELQKVVAVYQASNAENQLTADFCHLLGNLSRQTNDLKLAHVMLERAATLAPENIAVAIDLSAILVQLNRQPDAIRLIEAHLKRLPDNEHLRGRLAELKMPDSSTGP